MCVCVCVCVHERVCINCVYLFLVFLLPFDGEIKMYVYTVPHCGLSDSGRDF